MKSRYFLRIIGLNLAILGLSLSLVACPESPPADFQGTWAWSNDTAYFDLNLDVVAATITGYHEAGLLDGSRIDTSIPGDQPTVTGTLHGNQAVLTITSAYSPEVTYEATLTITGADTAEWRVTKSMDGQTYIPQSAQLKRRNAALEGETSQDFDNYEAQLITEALANKAQNEAALEAANTPAITLDIQDSTEGGSVEVYRLGQDLKRIQVSRYGETGSLISNYWFADTGSLELAVRSMSTRDPATGEELGSVESTYWYYRDGVLICARDGQENPILINGADIDSILEVITQDCTNYRNLGMEE